MASPDIHVFRSAPQFYSKNVDGVDVYGIDSINVRFIDTNAYVAFRLSLEDTQKLIKDLQAAIDNNDA